MTAYYNEFDPKAAAWLRELIKQGHIADGVVDERSIEDVTPNELAGFTQCHFFAGIGVWSYALRSAGWADDRPVWTGSCPCQPFSAAGKGAGFADERHLWPAFHHLISQCRPDIVLGEQVASKDGLGWLDLVHADLEATGYASGAVDLCAAGVGAPHIRQRLWWVGSRLGNGLEGAAGACIQWAVERPSDAGVAGVAGGLADTKSIRERADEPRRYCSDRIILAGAEQGGNGFNDGAVGGLADTVSAGSQGGIPGWQDTGRADQHRHAGRNSATVGMADTSSEHIRREFGGGDGEAGAPQGEARQRQRGGNDHSPSSADGGMADPRRPSPTNGHWRDADWLFCRDGKWRPVEPSTFPLAHGAAERVGRLRGYGNAINAKAAQIFIESVMGSVG